MGENCFFLFQYNKQSISRAISRAKKKMDNKDGLKGRLGRDRCVKRSHPCGKS